MKLKFFDKEQPLGLPKNSIRSLIALSFTGATIYCIVNGVDIIETLLPITTLIIGFYFAKRAGE